LTLSIVLLWSQVFVGLSQSQEQVSIENAFPNLTFNQPVGVFDLPDGTNQILVMEQPGVIRVFENSRSAGASSVFIDLESKVLYGGEQGLLGMALHPNYESNGYFYVNYVAPNPRRTVITRYTVSAVDQNRADVNSELVILEIEQPFANHNGGQITFGPDGYLYIGLGDGGSGGDPLGNGQNLGVLLGKILRIDVDSASMGKNYAIPGDNPFVGNSLGYREEIYAFGFRNPWRFSFDVETGRMWVADVGQSQREEIDLVEKGKNYGWNLMEGSLPYAGGDQEGLELPIWEYGRDEGLAVIGGYVYRHPTATALGGAYIYGDYGTGRIWALTLSENGAPTNSLLIDTSLNILSFGVDNDLELYICGSDGKIYMVGLGEPSPTLSPAPTSTATLEPTATPAVTPTSSPSASPSPSPTASPSKSPTPTSPPEEGSPILIIAFGVAIAVAAILIVVFMLKKK
jgi:glucose/arabinose dehydrogenase